jgi:hypothetical protein
MQSASVVQGAAGASKWVPVDYTKANFGVALGATISSGAGLTYKAQHTLDSPYNLVPCSISRSTTTASLTLADHGLSVGDSLTVVGAGDPLDGTFAVAAVTDANIVTYTVANSGNAASDAGARVCTMRVLDHSTMTGKTTASDGNYAFPIKAVRVNVTLYTSGKVTLTVNQGRA